MIKDQEKQPNYSMRQAALYFFTVVKTAKLTVTVNSAIFFIFTE